MKTALFVLSLILGFIDHVSWAAQPELLGVTPLSAQVIRVSGDTLFLNGQGVHSVFVFKVYQISLFAEIRSTDVKKLLNPLNQKLIRMRFLRDVTAEQLRKSLVDGFRENCGTNCKKLQPELNQLNAKIPDFKDGDELQLLFFPKKLILRSSTGLYFEQNDPELSRVLLLIWLGDNPPTEELKRQLLGLE